MEKAIKPTPENRTYWNNQWILKNCWVYDKCS